MVRLMKWLAFLLPLFVVAAPPVSAQGYPNRPVRIVVAFQAGQGTDVATRYIATQLSAALGQSVVIDNKPGAAGNLGTAVAAKATPDGYTLLMGTAGTHAMNPALFDNPGFDAEQDFEAIAVTCLIPMVISVHPSLGVNSLGDLIAAAKAQPDKIDVALPSTTSRVVSELLRQSGIRLFNVPYKGSATASADVLGGQVKVIIDTVGATRPLVGKLKPIAVTSATESALLPGVRSVAEQGVPGFVVVAWNALFVPRGTPAEVKTRLAEEMKKILARPETTKALRDLGFDAAPAMTPQEVTAWIRSERNKFGGVIKSTGMKPD